MWLIIFALLSMFPNYIGKKIAFPKYFLTTLFYVFKFIIINANKNHTVIR